MRASLGGREELAGRVQQALALPTKKESETVLETVFAALEATLLNNLDTDGFTLETWETWGQTERFLVSREGNKKARTPVSGPYIKKWLRGSDLN